MAPPANPVLYSFRRCPYAMRARMALLYSGVRVSLREVLLRQMPAELLASSPKGTVPVLILADGRVIEQSRDIMTWALARHDPHCWLPADGDCSRRDIDTLIDENDNDFKPLLDRYKYAERYPQHSREVYRGAGEGFLRGLDGRLADTGWLTGDAMTLADVAIFPFVRQFAHVDRDWFAAAPYPHVRAWLAGLLDSELFLGVMKKYPVWQAGDGPVRFPD